MTVLMHITSKTNDTDLTAMFDTPAEAHEAFRELKAAHAARATETGEAWFEAAGLDDHPVDLNDIAVVVLANAYDVWDADHEWDGGPIPTTVGPRGRK
jgi:alkylhydroperoxidase/carboxymuconolactone decarboxylase family protein YurZ